MMNYSEITKFLENSVNEHLLARDIIYEKNQYGIHLENGVFVLRDKIPCCLVSGALIGKKTHGDSMIQCINNFFGCTKWYEFASGFDADEYTICMLSDYEQRNAWLFGVDMAEKIKKEGMMK